MRSEDSAEISWIDDRKPGAPAAGRFGIAAGAEVQPRAYRPSGCPSLEQFEERFLLANDRNDAPRAA